MKKFVDAVYVGLLLLYVLAGVRSVPFHGDESTTLFIARDWYYLLEGKISTLYYDTSIQGQPKMEQDLRIINGVVSKYSIGFVETLTGQPIESLGTPWDWAQGWWENLAYGHLPEVRALFIARLSQTWFTLLSIALVFAISKRLGHWVSSSRGTASSGRVMAYVATFFYTSLPAVLLNGRRSIYESVTLFAIVFVVATGIIAVDSLSKQVPNEHQSRRWFSWVLLAIAGGLALASKHTTLLVVLPVFLVLLALVFLNRNRLPRLRMLFSIGCSGFLAIIIFFILNPIWWSQPLVMPGLILKERSYLLGVQLQTFGGFANAQDRILSLIKVPVGAPIYYEDNRFQQPLGDIIASYETAHLAGIDWSSMIGAVGVITLVGLYGLFQRRQNARIILFGFVMAFLVISTYFINPLPWQRYYLPLAPFIAILCGLGVAQCLHLISVIAHLLRKTKQQELQTQTETHRPYVR